MDEGETIPLLWFRLMELDAPKWGLLGHTLRLGLVLGQEQQQGLV